LVEVHWNGCQLLDVILGIGVNVGLKAIPPESQFNFPATSLEAVTDKEINRLNLLESVLGSLLKWYRRLAEPGLINAWNDRLAYKNQLVSLISPMGPLTEGKVCGVEEDGSLTLEIGGTERRQYHSGEIQMRLVDRS
jgi:biotin-(acetyl-CoA carboxylase) ligase